MSLLALGLLGLGGSFLSGLATNRSNEAMNEANIKAQREINAANLAFQRENLDYQKALQQEIFAREDTAYTRAVQDLRSAGLSPLAVTPGGSNAGQVVTTQPLNAGIAPQMLPNTAIGDALFGMSSQLSQLGMNEAQSRLLEAQAQKTNADATLVSDEAKFWKSLGISPHAPEWFQNYKLAEQELPRFLDMVSDKLGISPTFKNALKGDDILGSLFRDVASDSIKGNGQGFDLSGFNTAVRKAKDTLEEIRGKTRVSEKKAMKLEQKAKETAMKANAKSANPKAYKKELKEAEKLAEASRKAQYDYYYNLERQKIVEYYFGN